MNNRIAELRIQAWEQVNELKPDEREREIWFSKFFAQLIVQECVEIIRKEVSMKYKDGGEDEEFMVGHYAASVLARTKIKQHFGVE